MQGYIIGLRGVKDEDLIVEILSNHRVYTVYRFYGKRHGTINVGFKIDFEIETNIKSIMPRLKDVMHLGFSWILDSKKLYHWQRFVKLFATHFKDVDTLESFYFELFENAIAKIAKQNEKRVLIEAYIELLKYEGRLHSEFVCLLCDEEIKNDVSLVRAFIPTHPKCSYSKKISKTKIDELFNNASTFFLDDDEVEFMWSLLMQGL